MKYLALACLLLFSGSIQAVTLNFDATGSLVGASGIEVGSTSFDVEFAGGSCVDAFGDCADADFAFSSQSDALAAAQVLFDQVLLGEAFVDVILTQGPGAIEGCVAPVFACAVFTPYQTQGDSVSVVSGTLFGGRDFFDEPLSAGSQIPLTQASQIATYARWRLSEPTGFAALSIELVSPSEVPPLTVNGVSEETGNLSVSGNGRLIAFSSLAPNLQLGTTNNFVGIFVYDQDTENTESLTPAGNATSTDPSISRDGRFVAFESAATNLVAPDNTRATSRIFVYDRDTDTTELLTPGIVSGFASDPSISGDGRFVAFESNSPELNAAGVTSQDIFVYDRDSGTTEQLTAGANNTSSAPSISASLSLIHI